MARITKVEFAPKLEKKERVAAYTRVSCDKDTMLRSLSAQVSYYSNIIQSNSEWEYAGVYTDEALSGTKDNRADFQRMISDCKAGKIDRIITKSISRFARNTVTLLETVRMLKSLGVDVYFEEQNIHSMSADGELMLTILASYAQEESLSASENQKWKIRKQFEDGIPWCRRMFGYVFNNGKYEVVPDEAIVVKRIFKEYLEGSGTMVIGNRLTQEGVLTRNGASWRSKKIMDILKNYAYTGSLILQRTYSENHLTKKKRINDGQLPKYHVINSHEPIIDSDTFVKVQIEIERRAKCFSSTKSTVSLYPYSGLIKCAKCGKGYRRKKALNKFVWCCTTYNTRGKKYCDSKQIPESVLDDVLCDLSLAVSEVDCILADKDNTLHFNLKKGNTITYVWKDKSRRDSWTKEMREAARQKTIERKNK